MILELLLGCTGCRMTKVLSTMTTASLDHGLAYRLATLSAGQSHLGHYILCAHPKE